ncbi:Galactosyl transferase [Penicillium taxi]|uniref:Galactosyl transferase n=1 Tax=Penicillium taxi TaxID=168475 RepID=UPI00254591FC|nr:Galactosyl transferase [Penicillium taxi]KAJ5893701.1 Galactosyl transferase [Penicillium taxi]
MRGLYRAVWILGMISTLAFSPTAYLAKIHGYDYKLVHAPNFHRFGTWSKVSAIRDHLSQYKFVIFLDADAIFHYPHIPVEWLLNYWNITPDTLVALALDPSDPVNNDDYGQNLLNTGFMIAQQSERTEALFKAWDTCPENEHYPNCSRWSFQWPHEQGAFGNHIRYDFNRPEDVKILPCSEANGCPEAEFSSGCAGEFVQHWWYAKASVPTVVEQSILDYFLPYLHELFLNDYERVTLNASNLTLTGSGGKTRL